jgi:glycosyltransferase involved in cell wall biosynthesis
VIFFRIAQRPWVRWPTPPVALARGGTAGDNRWLGRVWRGRAVRPGAEERRPVMAEHRLCLVSRIPGVAGPAGFQRRLAEGLERRGIGVTYDLGDAPYEAVLVVGGTRHLAGLRAARQRGVAVLQRLNGMNWIHRRRRTGLRHFLRAELNNRILRLIRSRLATGLVYQSEFARGWWERACGVAQVPARVVLNGVPLNAYTPHGAEARPEDRIRLLVVEANLGSGYDIGLTWALDLAQRLQAISRHDVELAVAGSAPEALRRQVEQAASARVTWLGVVPPESIPALDRSAHLLFASDVMPACPNSVVEALACGLPVVSFDTGALPELVLGDAGRIVAYGGDAWMLEPPDLEALASAAADVVGANERFRRSARARAEAGLGVETMIDGYLGALGWDR